VSFIGDETSVDNGRPIELYRFVGSLDVYTYTSGNRAVTYNTETFRPIPITRSSIKLGDVTEKNELKVSLPITTKLVIDYGFDIPPPELTLEIYRVHGETGAVQPWFKGSVVSITMEGITASVMIPSIFSAYMGSEFPNVVYQSQCNHPLYSPMCGVNRDDFKLEGVIDSIIDETKIRVTAAADKPDGWLKAGEIVTESERRLIVEHTGSELTLNYPFRSMVIGMDITAYAGCKHDIETCNGKFNNLVNFLGFPYTPSLNPFIKGLR
jgi:uncharacterized phage protein (TIGR02218 family)